jgi:hypothetical protein
LLLAAGIWLLAAGFLPLAFFGEGKLLDANHLFFRAVSLIRFSKARSRHQVARCQEPEASGNILKHGYISKAKCG